MKIMKKRNVDLNLNSDFLGRKKMSLFKFDAFLLQGRNLLFGLFFSVGTGKSLELMRSVAFWRHLMAVCPLGFGLRYCIWYILPFFLSFFFNWAIVLSLKCSGISSQAVFCSLQICMFCFPMPSCGPPFYFCLGLPLPPIDWVANKSSDFKELQPSVRLMSSSQRRFGNSSKWNDYVEQSGRLNHEHLEWVRTPGF